MITSHFMLEKYQLVKHLVFPSDITSNLKISMTSHSISPQRNIFRQKKLNEKTRTTKVRRVCWLAKDFSHSLISIKDQKPHAPMSYGGTKTFKYFCLTAVV